MEFRLKATIGALLVAALFAGAIAAPELRAFAAAMIGSADIIDESILSVDIKNGEVKNSDLATDAVTGAKIKNLSIKTSDLGDSIVTSGKIKDGTIQRHDIATGILPTGANRVFYGSCILDIEVRAHSLGWPECFVPGVLNGDLVVGTFREYQDFGDFDMTLVSVTSHCDEEVSIDGHLCIVVRNNSDTDFKGDPTLQFIAFQ